LPCRKSRVRIPSAASLEIPLCSGISSFRPPQSAIRTTPHERIYKLRLEILEPLGSPGWGLLLGALLHNLRASPDHLIWQLVVLNGEHPSRSNQFPICSQRERYWESRGRQGSIRERTLAGVADATARGLTRSSHSPRRSRTLSTASTTCLPCSLGSQMLTNTSWSPAPSSTSVTCPRDVRHRYCRWIRSGDI